MICLTSGLTLIFNVDQDEYMGTIAPNAGVRVVVHPQYRMPFPEDEGISILPGQVTYVGVRLVRFIFIHNLPFKGIEQIILLINS